VTYAIAGGRGLTSACSITPAGVLVRRSASVHHRSMPNVSGSAGVLLKRGVGRTKSEVVLAMKKRVMPLGEAGSSQAQRVILEVVDSQLESNDPPETRNTLDRLRALGHSVGDAKRLIACCVATEIWHSLHPAGGGYDRDRYLSHLNRLPELPFDGEE